MMRWTMRKCSASNVELSGVGNTQARMIGSGAVNELWLVVVVVIIIIIRMKITILKLFLIGFGIQQNKNVTQHNLV